MTNPTLRQLFNQAVTDLAFRNRLFGNLHRVLLENGVKENTACFIEDANPQTIQALAKVLETIDEVSKPVEI